MADDLGELYGIPDDVLSPPSAKKQRAPPRKVAPASDDQGDGISIDELAETAKKSAAIGKSSKSCKPGGLKLLILLFISFLLVVSDAFTNGVVRLFGGAVKARSPTSYGIIIQGICLVLLFIVASHLVDVGIL